MNDNDLKELMDSREPITIEQLRKMTVAQLNEYTTANNKRYSMYAQPKMQMLKVCRDEFEKICANGKMIEQRHDEIAAALALL